MERGTLCANICELKYPMRKFREFSDLVAGMGKNCACSAKVVPAVVLQRTFIIPSFNYALTSVKIVNCSCTGKKSGRNVSREGMNWILRTI